jgi:hypothetical protein
MESGLTMAVHPIELAAGIGGRLHRGQRWAAAGLAMAVLLTAGCGSSQGPARYPVAGTVTLGGQPLPDGEVYFRVPATGGIDVFPVKAGAFAGMAVAGRHRVEIYRFEQPQPTAEQLAGLDEMARVLASERHNLIPAAYNARSGLEADVRPDQANQFEFSLSGR